MLARTGMPEPFKWEDVKGKTIIGARLGGVPQMVLEWVLKKHGIKPFEDVNIVTSLAFAAARELQGVGKIVASMGVEGGEIAYTVFHVRRSQLTRDRDMLIRFTRAIIKGMRWVEEHTSEEIAETVAPYFPDTDLDVLARIVQRYRDQGTWPKTPEPSAAGFARLQEIMIEAGELEAQVPASILQTQDIVRAALESLK